MTVSIAKKDYNYHIWASNRVWDRIQELPEEVYTQEMKSVFPTVVSVLTHLYITDAMYLKVLNKVNFQEIVSFVEQLKVETTAISAAELRSRSDELASDYFHFLESYEDLNAKFVLSHPHFGQLDSTLAEVIKHVVNHGTYHRGNISAMLHQLGFSGASTDYIFYAYEVGQTVR
ncbi:DinB family protein [Paenibacillus sp. N1-5-1-14]|uniref:DinB family protein n=1 Tax=Paenibacillus radicibacter TaxID=2972488 RepID=UPI00215981CC|nr:DinB family protein [Paenibacillus radicibacter]MCR8641057.1 DinB family protein [Paenibacillus radicibacter]